MIGKIASGAFLLFQFRHRFFDETESEVFSRCALDGCHRLDLCGAIRHPNLVVSVIHGTIFSVSCVSISTTPARSMQVGT